MLNGRVGGFQVGDEPVQDPDPNGSAVGARDVPSRLDRLRLRRSQRGTSPRHPAIHVLVLA